MSHISPTIGEFKKLSRTGYAPHRTRTIGDQVYSTTNHRKPIGSTIQKSSENRFDDAPISGRVRLQGNLTSVERVIDKLHESYIPVGAIRCL